MRYLFIGLFLSLSFALWGQASFVSADEVGVLNTAWEKVTINALLGIICYFLYRELKTTKDLLRTLQKEKDDEVKELNEKLFTLQTSFLSEIKTNLQEINRTMNDYGKTLDKITYKLP
jgi:hypothetical protein